MSDAVLQFLLANLALSGGILLVFALRKPVRSQFGARLAYALWLLPLLAAAASFLPPRVVEIITPAIVAPAFEPIALALTVPEFEPIASVVEPAVAPAPVVAVDPWAVGGLVWIAGMIAMAAWLAVAQMRFMAGVRRGEAGPAVVGFLRPRIVTPTDFEMRYDPGERRVILAHETIHLDRNDARINALAALVRCVCWFNPLVHLAVHALRIDQELACDAAVVERHPKARKLYADALLKTQLTAHPLPLGCYWPAGTEHPLMERIEMLKRTGPGRLRGIAGAGLLAVLASGACFTAWAAMPAEVRYYVMVPDVAPSPGVSAAVVQTDKLEIVAATAPQAEPAPEQQARDDRSALSAAIAAGDVRSIIEAGGTARDVAAAKLAKDPPQPGARPNPARYPDPATAQFVRQPDGTIDLMWTGPRGAHWSNRLPETSVTPVGVVGIADVQSWDAPLQASSVIDTSDPIHLLGKVEKIDFSDTTYVAFVRASSIAACPQGPETVNTELWELSPTPYWGDRDAVIKDLMNASVYVRGFNAKDKSCAQNCRMLARGVFKGMGSQSAFTDPALTCPRAPQPAVHGEPSLLEIRADRGRRDEPGRTTVYEGDVEVRYNGQVFKTDRLLVEDGAESQRAAPRPSQIVLSPRLSIGASSPLRILADTAVQDQQNGTAVYSGNVELRGADRVLRANRLTSAPAQALTPISTPEPQKLPAPEGQHAKKPGPEGNDVQKDLLKNRVEKEIIEKKKSQVEEAELKRQAMKSRAEIEKAERERRLLMESKTEEGLRGGKLELRKREIPKDQDLMNKLGSAGGIDKLRRAEAVEKPGQKADEIYTPKQTPSKSPEPTSPPATQSIPQPPQPTSAPQTPRAASIPFARYFDAKAPVMLKGRVTAIDVFEGHAMVRVQEIESTTPGTIHVPYQDVTKMWRVVLGRLDTAPAWARDPALIGKVVEIRGYRGKDKDCGLDCLMSGRDVILSGKRLQGWLVPERPKPPPPQLKPI